MSRKKYETEEEYRKRRHDEFKKYQKKKIEYEEENGLKLLGKRIRISDYVKEKVLSGKIQILIIQGKLVQFRKRVDNGYWVNTNTKNHNRHILYFHREKYKQEYGLTEEDIKEYEVHHIDGNKDNNDIRNLQLLTREEHHAIHNIRKEGSHRHICKKCGRAYWSSVSKSINVCDRCEPKYAIGGSSVIIIKKICLYCGAEYETKGVNRNKSKFCSNKCKSAYRRMQGVDNVERVCIKCGEIYLVNKYSEGKICRKCSGK